MTAQPIAPGALNVIPVGNELVEMAGVGPTTQQATVAQIAAGGSQQRGTVVMNGATPVVVANANMTANSVVLFGLKTVGGTVGAYPAVQTVTPGTGFTVAGTAGDTSTYNYSIQG